MVCLCEDNSYKIISEVLMSPWWEVNVLFTEVMRLGLQVYKGIASKMICNVNLL
jgi:hypothetical protein